MKENSMYKWPKDFMPFERDSQNLPFFCIFYPYFRLMKHVIKFRADRDFNPKMIYHQCLILFSLALLIIGHNIWYPHIGDAILFLSSID